MYAFDYIRTISVEDAVRRLQADPEAKLLAGGQSLIPALKLRLAQPSRLVDIRRVPGLSGLTREGDRLVIGATTSHAQAAAKAQAIPALARLIEGIGDPAVRNLGTIGGSLANADPAADYPAAILGLGATIRTDRR
ncbi:MAG: FAD binding domain-containing protein, partial [Rhodospirillales bacterium]|nr:FAD binding domain-containing protein [Rhodospirillales bacterium]